MIVLLLTLFCAQTAFLQEKAGIVILATGFRNDNGVGRAALFSSSKGFPSKTKKALRIGAFMIKDSSGTMVFSGIVPGTYAVSVYHDENNNGELDSNFIGIPKEEVGSSNNPNSRFGPPSYDDSKFDVNSGTVTLKITIKYI